MMIKPISSRPIPTFLLPFSQATSIQTRNLHHRIKAPRTPRPIPFVPDVQTFLTLIGRNLSQHGSKIQTWKALFSLTSPQLKELGIEPPRARRYLLRWREKFRNGQFGIGGDFKYVQNGTANLGVVEVPAPGHDTATATLSAGKRKIVANLATEGSAEEDRYVQAKGVRLQGTSVVGPHVTPVKGGKGAKLVVQEGLWENRRGHKIDGGERRQAMVRAKARGEEKKGR